MILIFRICLFLLLLTQMAHNSCYAHSFGVEGLFYALNGSGDIEDIEKQPISLERNKKGHCSTVVSINGVAAFNRYVILASFKKPVIVKICSERSQESLKVKQSFQQASSAFLGKASFIACDIFDQINDFSENYNVIMQVMGRENITQLSLPLFLFYKDGVLYRPEHLPAAMLHGFYTKENLEAFINRKFFQQDSSPVLAETQQDSQSIHTDRQKEPLRTYQGSLLDMTPTLTGK